MQYSKNKDSQQLLKWFAKKYGDYKFCEIFSNCNLSLKNKKLSLIFTSGFIKDRFLYEHHFDSFIDYCKNTFDFNIYMKID